MNVTREVFFISLLGWMVVSAFAAEPKPERIEKNSRVVYKKNTKLDFDAMSIQGELKNPAEFYFESRPPEKFDSLVSKRKNFHKEMLRDAVMSK